MAVTLSVIAAKDGAGATIVGGVQAIDLSGAGTGPWSPGNVILDGLLGVQRAAVVAVSTAPVTATHPALVSVLRPDSAGIITTGTKGVPSTQILTTQEATPTIGTQSIVGSSASSVTVLAANTTRLGASVYNDSTAILYLLLTTGGTASATVYTVQLPAASYYEVPYNFVGALIGIWASANGNARVMEYT